MNRFFTLLLAASCLTAVGQVPDYVPTEGLLAWWTFNGDTQDASDNQIHGTSMAASFVPDRFNNDAGAIHMEGNGLVDFGLDQRFGVVSGTGRTVAFWVKSEMQVIPRLQKYQNSVSGNSNFFIGPAPYPPFSAANGITVTANGASAYTTIDLDWSFWFHVAVVYDGAIGESTLFIDGVPVATEPLTFNTNVSSKPLQLIAARVSNDYPDSNGEVDDLGFWQRVLTHDEILALFEAPAPITGCTNPSACNFDGEAVLDDGSCEESGCIDSYACNYTAEAFCDDGSCDYSCCPGPGCCDVGTEWSWASNTCIVANPADINLDGCVQLNDLLDLLSAYGDCGSEESAWLCGDPLEYQGYDYETVQIGEQCWFAENLRAENYRNGGEIVSGQEEIGWSTFEVGQRTIYGEGTSDCDNYIEELDACDESLAIDVFGLLYNAHAVINAQELCPTDWHVPSETEWDLLKEQSISVTDDFQSLLSIEYWSNGTGNNSSGFNALPGGNRYSSGWFSNAGSYGCWWTSTVTGLNEAKYILINGSQSMVTLDSNFSYGFSVRCIKDTD